MNHSSVDMSQPIPKEGGETRRRSFFTSPQVFQKARQGLKSAPGNTETKVRVINGPPPAMPPMVGKSPHTKPALFSENVSTSAAVAPAPVPQATPSPSKGSANLTSSPDVSSSPTNGTSAIPPGHIMRFVTKTQTRIVDGKEVVEKTTVTFIEPANKRAQPQGWGGKLLKKLGRGGSSKGNNKGPRRLSTSEMNSVLTSVPETTAQADTQVPTVATTVPPPKRKAGRFQRQRPKQATPSHTVPLAQPPAAPEAASTSQRSKGVQPAVETTTKQAQPLPPSTPSTSTPPLRERSVNAPSRPTSSLSPSSAGVPSMFASAASKPRWPVGGKKDVSFPSPCTASTATKVPVQTQEPIPEGSKGPAAGPILSQRACAPVQAALPAPPAPILAPCPTPAPIATVPHPVAQPTAPTTWEPPAPTNTSPTVMNDDETILEYYSVVGDDVVSEYEEITIQDDEMYQITYYEEETVVDDDVQHDHQAMMGQQHQCGTAPPSGGIRLEGMDLLMSNIRNEVDTVH